MRHYLQSIADYNNVVKLPKTVRKVLLRDVGISENRFIEFMNDLRKSQFIRGKNDFFMINPRISFKGSRVKRNAFINNRFWETDYFLIPEFEKSFRVRKIDKRNYEFVMDSKSINKNEETESLKEETETHSLW